MRRTQIQLDEQTYQRLRLRAFKEGCSISSLIRRALAKPLGKAKPGRRPTINDFSFIRAGRSRQGRLKPVSERHDEALEDAYLDAERR